MTKADNNTFIDEHFAHDSVLVLVKGACLSSVIEALCLKVPALRRGHSVGFCQGFAPEVVTLVHLAKSQWTIDVVKAWPNLNTFLFWGTLFYASGLPITRIRNAMISMVYYHAARSLASTAASYQAEIKQQDKKGRSEISGVLSGLMAGGLSLGFAYRNTLQYPTFTLLESSVGAALVTTLFYVAFGDSEKMSDSEKAFAGVVSGAVAGAVAGAVVGVGVGVGVVAVLVALGVAAVVVAEGGVKDLTEVAALAEIAVFLALFVVVGIVENRVIAPFVLIKVLAIGGALTGALTKVKALDGAVAVGRTVIAAGAGAGIIMMTGCISRTLFQSSDATAIGRSLTVVAATGLPLMVSSWLVSLERFVEENVSMHETMQNEFMFSLPVSKVLSLANWVNWPAARDWFTD